MKQSLVKLLVLAVLLMLPVIIKAEVPESKEIDSLVTQPKSGSDIGHGQDIQNAINTLFFKSFDGTYVVSKSKLRPELIISLPF